MSEAKKTGRNAAAVAANFRNSAGSMKDKRAARGGASNATRGFLAEYEEDCEIAEEVSYLDEPELSLHDLGMDDADDDDDDYGWDYSWQDDAEFYADDWDDEPHGRDFDDEP